MNSGQVTKAVISVPVTASRSALKFREKARLKSLEQVGTKYFDGHRNLPPIISCRVPQLNHYRGQVYSPMKRMPMASEQWQHRGTIGDFFTIVPFHGNYAAQWNQFALQNLKSQEQETGELDLDLVDHLKTPTFKAYNLDESIVKSLEKLGFRTPTNIQDSAIPKLLSGDSSIVAAETGNGKTLAYLLSIIQRTLQFKRENLSLKDRPLNSPLSVIVTPGRELSSQIFDVAQQICNDVGIEARLVLGGSTDYKLLHDARKETDIVIGSLGGLRKCFFGKLLHRNYISSIVLDEADTLVDDTFKSKMLGLVSYLSSQTGKVFVTGTQFIFVGATFPRNIENSLRDLMDTDSLTVIRTHYLHRILSHIKQKFIRAPKCERPAYLLDIIQPDVQKSRPVLIFSNKTTTASFVSHFLNGRGVECRHFSSDIDWRVRGNILSDFLAGKFKFLSCTDLVSRGIDTSNVFHVVNYDFPSNVSDYIHRVGRVGRIGTSQPQGHVTSLVCGKTSIEVVQAIERSVRTNNELSDVDNNIVEIIRRRHHWKKSNHDADDVDADSD